MKPARVYLVVWWFDRMGGMERHVTDLAIALARRGIEVTVFSETPLPASNTYGRELRAGGVAVSAPRTRPGLSAGVEASRPYRVLAGLDREPEIGWAGMEDDYLRHRHASAGARALLNRLERHARQAPPDIVHLHGSRLGQHGVLQWAAARGYPSVYTEHVTMSDWGGPFDPESPWVVSDAADAIVCVSDYSRASLLAHLPAPREVELARHIVRDPKLDDPAAACPRAAGAASTSLLAVGRLSLLKGYDTLLDAAAQLRDHGLDLHIRIAGEGEDRAVLEAQRDRLNLGDRVTFLGQVGQARIAELWKEADFGVAPSRTEALPLSIVEAMARARPMVASRVGGIPEIIRHGENGLLVEPGDAAALADAIRRMIEEPGLAAKLAAGARRGFETGGWSEDAVAERILATYAKARAARAGKTKTPGSTWAVAQATAAADPMREVCLFTWRLSSFGDLEHLVAQQARALARAGVRVTVFAEQPVRPFNAYVRAMRRAGVEVIAPALPLSLARRLWSRLTGRSRGAHGAAFARRQATRPSDLVQLHGWGLSGAWMNPVLRQAAASGTPTAYTEHADQTSAASAADLAALQEFGALSAASSSAAVALGLATGRPVATIRHAGQARPALPAAIPAASDPLRVFCLLPPEQVVDLALATAASIISLEAAALDPARRADQLAGCGLAALSPAMEGFGPALAEATSAFKPVIICGEGGDIPIRRGANGQVVDGAPAAAVLDLAADRLLARQFAVAARRTYELEGLRELAIVAETAALRRAAGG